MKNLVLPAVLASAVALIGATAASAQSVPAQFYGNLGYSFIDGDSGVNLGAINARAGVQLHRYFGLEAEGAIGVDSDRATVAGTTVTTKLRRSIGAYAVGFVPVTPQFDLLVRGGYGGSRIRATAPGAKITDNEDSWNYGVGAQYTFDGKNGVRGDFTRHDFGDGFGHADVWTVAYVRKF